MYYNSTGDGIMERIEGAAILGGALLFVVTLFAGGTALVMFILDVTAKTTPTMAVLMSTVAFFIWGIALIAEFLLIGKVLEPKEEE